MFFQVLFSYAEFVELFNWEKTGNRPCGLLNCGNRFVLKSKVKYQPLLFSSFFMFICASLDFIYVSLIYFLSILKTLSYYVSYTVALRMWFYNVLHAPGR